MKLPNMFNWRRKRAIDDPVFTRPAPEPKYDLWVCALDCGENHFPVAIVCLEQRASTQAAVFRYLDKLDVFLFNHNMAECSVALLPDLNYTVRHMSYEEEAGDRTLIAPLESGVSEDRAVALMGQPFLAGGVWLGYLDQPSSETLINLSKRLRDNAGKAIQA